jgi:hypothetical protein
VGHLVLFRAQNYRLYITDILCVGYPIVNRLYGLTHRLDLQLIMVMMMDYTPDKIRSLHVAFGLLKKYKEKLLFFDGHFGCVPYTYPAFDPELTILLKQEGINNLIELFENERRNAVSLERRFQFGEEEYVFNVVPLNPYPQVLNDYLIQRFMERDEQFNSLLTKIPQPNAVDAVFLEKRKRDAFEKMEFISLKVKTDFDRSFRQQFLGVFLRGYSDYRYGILNTFSSRKKFIEIVSLRTGNDVCTLHRVAE